MRMCYLCLKRRFFNTRIINERAPTEDKEEEEQEEFYKLERAYDKLPANDIRIIVGDMNAKIGKGNILRSHAGMYSLHENTSENGGRLVNFAVSKNMFIGSTKLNHNIINHLLIDKRHLSNLMDVRSYRGANIESDHYLVRKKLRARISKAKTST
jgi:endonuclease/exonuclease/phosphatase family metal-dependent hydrolase